MAATVQGIHLTKMYRMGGEQFYALDDASLEVHPGELVAVVGKRSSGKSTLLHILGCLQKADSGHLSIEGLDVSRMEDEQLATVPEPESRLCFPGL